MIEPSPSEVAAIIARHLPEEASITRCWPLLGGYSARLWAAEYEAPGCSPRRLILRRPSASRVARIPHASAHEHMILTALSRPPRFPSPRPIAYTALGDDPLAPYLLMEFVDGEPAIALKGGEEVGELARELANLLASLHARDPSALCLPPLPAASDLATRLVMREPDVWDEALGERSIRDRARQVWPPKEPASAALLHGDAWPGNVLWRDGSARALIDWEDACIGSPWMDVAITRLDLMLLYGEDAASCFLDAYARKRPLDKQALRCWGLYAALRPCGHLMEWARDFTHGERPDLTFSKLVTRHSTYMTHLIKE